VGGGERRPTNHDPAESIQEEKSRSVVDLARRNSTIALQGGKKKRKENKEKKKKKMEA